MAHVSRPARAVANFVGIAVLLVMVFPVYWMINSAFLPRNKIRAEDPTWFPFGGTVDNFQRVLDGRGFSQALLMSLGVTISTVLIVIVFAFFAALAVSRFRFKGRKSFILTLLLIQMIPVEALFISQYKVLETVGLLNTVAGLTIMYVAAVLPFTIWTLRGFADGVPAELEEAAMIDGCSRMSAFMRVTFPLLAPGLVATGVFGFIQAWNEFTLAVVVMTRQGKQTLPVWLAQFTDAQRGVDWGAIMAASCLIAVPVVIFFLIVQGRMTSGLTSGAVKG